MILRQRLKDPRDNSSTDWKQLNDITLSILRKRRYSFHHRRGLGHIPDRSIHCLLISDSTSFASLLAYIFTAVTRTLCRIITSINLSPRLGGRRRLIYQMSKLACALGAIHSCPSGHLPPESGAPTDCRRRSLFSGSPVVSLC
jgi:hypothetical protein